MPIVAEAARVYAPKEGAIYVASAGTSTTSVAAIDLSTAGGIGYWTFVAEEDMYITFNSNATITAPNGSTLAGAARTWYLPKDQEMHRSVQSAALYAEARARTTAGKIRYYKSGD